MAVVADADDLSEAEMRQIARWTNFSETTFLLKPTNPAADYRVRIFTPQEEFDFAGHPTLGTARVFAKLSNHNGDMVQECGLGLITVRQRGEIFSFATPTLKKSGDLSDCEIQDLCASLHIDPRDVLGGAWVDNGPGWQLLHLSSAALVRSVTAPRTPGLKLGLVGFFDKDEAQENDDLYEVRAFTPEFEDPVTGSFNGGAAQYLRGHNLVPDRYTVAQGRSLGRFGRVHIHDDGTSIWVGGTASIRVNGTLCS